MDAMSNVVPQLPWCHYMNCRCPHVATAPISITPSKGRKVRELFDAGYSFSKIRMIAFGDVCPMRVKFDRVLRVLHLDSDEYNKTRMRNRQRLVRSVRAGTPELEGSCGCKNTLGYCPPTCRAERER
jgi:hypothetical protein